jgi:hypothetical protein
MVQRLDELLQHCTVKITVPGHMGWGTESFGAPGLILTCAHVVKALKSDAMAGISWQQPDGVAKAAIACVSEARIAELIPEFDLALLSISTSLIADLLVSI